MKPPDEEKENNKKKLHDGESRQLTIWLRHFNRFTCVHSAGGKNLLHFACHLYHDLINTDVIAMLLDAGIDPDESDENHDTPAHYIANDFLRHMHPDGLDHLRLLVNVGAHLNRANKNGQTALEKLGEIQEQLGNAAGHLELEEIINKSRMKSEFPSESGFARNPFGLGGAGL
jgi:hypothetical protein